MYLNDFKYADIWKKERDIHSVTFIHNILSVKERLMGF